jgi:hypothetical protein
MSNFFIRHDLVILVVGVFGKTVLGMSAVT